MARIDFDLGALTASIDAITPKLEAALVMYMRTKAQNLEDHMKSNRPWTDRTNAARQSLSASVHTSSDEIDIQLAHGVDYGIWLELANEKNYAIVEPTVRLKSPEVFNGIKGLMGRIGK